MTTSSVVVGVDVAKDRLDVAVRPSGETWSEVNEEVGITALVARLRPLGPALIVCEATGGFERAAIAALAAAGLPVVVGVDVARTGWTWRCGRVARAGARRTPRPGSPHWSRACGRSARR